MIDIENKVFDTIFNAVKAYDSGVNVIGDAEELTAVFPTVTVQEIDNETLRKTMTDENKEQHARISYEFNVYVDNANGKKAKAKAIADVIDKAMLEMRFTKLMLRRVPNVDRTIYRIYGRYTAIVGKPVTVDGNTVYPIYRR